MNRSFEIFKIAVNVENLNDDLFFTKLPTKAEVISALINNRDSRGFDYQQAHKQCYKTAIELISLATEWLLVDGVSFFLDSGGEVYISVEKIRVVDNQTDR